jgi:hypothetical protein
MVLSPPSIALGLNRFHSAQIAYACSHSLACQALGLSNRRKQSSIENHDAAHSASETSLGASSG